MSSEASNQSPDTQALIAGHRAGDPEALPRLIERYYERIARMVRVRLGKSLAAKTEVDDVLQDVLLRVVDGIDRYEARSDAHWIAWVARLVQNEISNQSRRFGAEKRRGPTADLIRSYADSTGRWDPAANATGVHTRAARSEEAGIVDECLSELTEPHREVILLRDYAESDWATIAEIMERPTAEACQELHRRAKLELARRIARRL